VSKPPLLLRVSSGLAEIRTALEAQMAGQMVQDDPERLATVYNACISGLAFDLLFEREQYLANFPDVDSVLRILKKETYHDNNIQKE
jgi:hypothetical protein